MLDDTLGKAAQRSKLEIGAGLTVGAIAFTMIGLFALAAFNQKLHISDTAAYRIQWYAVNLE